MVTPTPPPPAAPRRDSRAAVLKFLAEDAFAPAADFSESESEEEEEEEPEEEVGFRRLIFKEGWFKQDLMELQRDLVLTC